MTVEELKKELAKYPGIWEVTAAPNGIACQCDGEIYGTKQIGGTVAICFYEPHWDDHY